MAGQPRTRARRQLEALESLSKAHPELKAAILDATGPNAGQLNARARAQGHLKAALMAGPLTRAAVDTAIGDEISRLAAALHPGITARIVRLRPTWGCLAGWIEDYPLDSGKIGELLDYLATEHGGTNYRITLLGPDGQPYFDTSLPIAGPPRKRGRPVDRDAFEGESAAARPIAQAATPPAQNYNEGMFKIFEHMLDNERHSSEKLVSSIRELISASSKGNEELLKSVVAARRSEIEAGSFTHQIGELARGAAALEEVKAALTSGDRSAVVKKDDDNLDGVFKDAAKDFISKAMTAKFTKSGNGRTSTTNADLPPAKLD